MKKIIFVIFVLAVGIGLGIYFQRQPKTEKVETKLQTEAEQAGADIKSGVAKAGDVATNVAGHVKAAAQKVGEFTTNAVGEIKQKLN
jgi:uncharacterized protein YxeA